MEFATKMEAMCAIRSKTGNYLCDKLKIDNSVMALIRKGEVIPAGNLELRIRRELNWPREVDDLFDEIKQSTYQADDPTPTAICVPVSEDEEPATVETPILKPSQILQKRPGRPRKEVAPVAIKPPNTFKKTMSMSYLQRSAIGSDVETGNTGTLHGSVVG